jgi:lauroyl/myristoyl acyltransferase
LNLRHVLSWKSLFYDALLPALRRLGPGRCDAVIAGLGRLHAVWPGRRRELTEALVRARGALRADWDPETLRASLAANAARFAARDYPLDGPRDDEVLARFDVTGFDGLRAALEEGHGAIVVGSHLGAHIAALHWLFRRGVPLRLLVQRPRHVSRMMDRRFDRDEPHPQSSFFVRRDLDAAAATERLLRARAALRDGLAVYMAGDIPWQGPSARPGRLLGQRQTFLSVWADLAAVTRAPVLFLFCTHLPGGRYRLAIDPPQRVAEGEQSAAVARYLARLEMEIAGHPDDAVAHLLWPCYGPAAATLESAPRLRPSRRIATARL